MKRLLAAAHALGKGNALRGAILLTAIILSIAGCLAPHTDKNLLAALLFVCAAALGLVATARSLDDGHSNSPLMSPSSAPRPAAQRARPLPRTLQDLSPPHADALTLDMGHWSRITQSMSHELRTPLNAVLGFSELMASESFGPLGSPQYVDYARAINASGRTLLKSAEDALAITNLLTGQNSNKRPQAASVRGALNDMLAFHQIQQSHIGLDLSGWNDTNCDIAGEAQTLRQILINIMTVALEQASHSAAIRLTCSPDAQEITISAAVDGVRPEGRVHDDNFSLALARTLIQLSHARITESRSPNGWSVEIVFPRASQQDFFALT